MNIPRHPHREGLAFDRIKKMDLNLLPALYVLVEECSVTRAARRMLITQPGMSRALTRLRAIFNDQLLVWSRGQYEPTQRALILYTQIKEMVPRIGELFEKHASEFDPGVATGVFRIEAADFGASVILPGLVWILDKRAPGIHVEVYPLSGSFERLEKRLVDLVLTPMPLVGATLKSELLLQDRLVCLIGANNPLAKRTLTLERYLRAEHIFIGLTTPMMRRDMKVSIERQPVLGKLLVKIGQDINLKVRLPYFSPIGPIVANTNLIATLPLQVARRVRNSRTRIVPAPKEIGVLTEIQQVWRFDDDSDPMHRWVRALMSGLGRRVIRDLRSLSHPSESQKQILGLH